MKKKDINKLVKIVVAAVGEQDNTKLTAIGNWLDVKLFEKSLENRELLYGIFKDIDSLPDVNILFAEKDMSQYPDLIEFSNKYPFL